MSYYSSTRVSASCNVCGYSGTPYALELHDCAVQEFGGRHEDWPACGCDSDGCQTLPEHTSAYWSEIIGTPREAMAYEPYSPEWYDAQDRWADYDDEEIWYDSLEECEASGDHAQDGDGVRGKADTYECRYCGNEYVIVDDGYDEE